MISSIKTYCLFIVHSGNLVRCYGYDPAYIVIDMMNDLPAWIGRA